MEEYLIVGLGNPGTKYEGTRHNVGQRVIDILAKRYAWPFKRSFRVKGKAAVGVVREKKIHLLFPTTYMNLSGRCVRKYSDYYKISLERVLIVVDDVYLKFGTVRLREKGSPGGHNGLKSVEAALGTQAYTRLKVGVGNDELPDRYLEEYVLENFSKEEQTKLPVVLELGAEIISTWMEEGFDAACQQTGGRKNNER